MPLIEEIIENPEVTKSPPGEKQSVDVPLISIHDQVNKQSDKADVLKAPGTTKAG